MKPKDVFGRYGCVPREMHPAWQRVSYYARALGKDLISRIDDFDSMRVETSGDWKSSLCLTLAINGSERRNAKGALDALVDTGLLTVGDGFVTVNMQPVCSQSGSVSAVTLQSVGVRKGSVVVPDSAQVPENTQVASDSKQAIKASERATRARPDLVGFNWYCSTLELLPTSAPAPGSWREQYAFAGSKPDAERKTVAAAIRGDAWCMANKHLVSPEHVRKHWQKYLGGDARPVLKPVVATQREELTAAREATRAAQIEVNRMRDAPWFDKEEKWYASGLAQAEADLSKARAAETLLLKSATVRAVAS